jgi:DNA-nicking Smr family endonuclease
MQDSNQNNEICFDQLMTDVTPFKQGDRITIAKPKHTLAQELKREALEREHNPNQNYLSVETVTPLEPYDMLEYKKAGVQEGVYKNLRLGKYRIESVLNVQNRKLEHARKAVFESVKRCYEGGTRTLLIKHGIGLNEKPFPAFIKSYVNQWLRQMPEILAFHSAATAHGGTASVYVFIKKNNQQKAENRELHRRRGS